MEGKPLGIKAMILSPGAVKSNLSKNHEQVFNLPQDSLYKGFLDQIIRRMHTSQTANAMPTAEFSQRAVAKILSSNPPLYVELGGSTGLTAFLKWLPRSLVLWIIWKSFSKK